MTAAARELIGLLERLERDSTSVMELICGSRTPEPWKLYPDDCGTFSIRTRSQFYYHVHGGAQNEAGHFHTVRFFPDRTAHIVAISMAPESRPRGHQPGRDRRGAEGGLEHNRGVTAGGACDGCGISFDRAAAAFQFQTLDGPILKCARCAVRHRPMLKRSTAVALVVGTVLMIINQGDVLLGAKWPGALIWKIPLTYLVPFVVATWGALVNGRVRG